ncbi:MAG TPA: ClpXP protease specificity-enhancing factor SspB, partial [Nevskiaceae bacterium]
TDQPGVVIPRSYAHDGHIALNISPQAVQGFDPSQEPLVFSARFAGRTFDVQVPVGAVLAVYARENGEGIAFGEPEGPAPHDPDSRSQDSRAATPKDGDGPTKGRPKLRLVK